MEDRRFAFAPDRPASPLDGTEAKWKEVGVVLVDRFELLDLLQARLDGLAGDHLDTVPLE